MIHLSPTLPRLAQVLVQACAEHVQRVALRDEQLQLTYAAWLEQAQGLAADLLAQGCISGTPVMVKSSNHPMDFVALLGIWLAGGVAVPVHRSAPEGVVAGIQSKARCRWVVDLGMNQEGQRTNGLTAHPLPAGSGAFEPVPELEGAALVIFTSGSTGLPKGVVLTHAAFAGKLEQNQRLFGISHQDVCLLVLNNTFSFGIWMALLTLSRGGTVVTRSRFSPEDFAPLLLREGITFTGVVPTMIRATLGGLSSAQQAAAREYLAASSLRTMVIGGEPLGLELSAQLRALIHPAALYDVYGLTETATSDFVLHPEAYEAHPGSIGRPAGGVSYRIVGDDGRVCPPGQSGELQLKTPYIMAAYLGDADLTAAAFADGWFRTGDLALCDEQDHVTIVGRLKELVVRGGNKIAPAEIERALVNCPGVASAMVAGMPDLVLGQRIHALLVPRPDETIDAARVRAHLAQTLERFKHPDACYIGTELPTGRTGKLERAQLPRLIAAGLIQPLPAWAT